MPRCHSSHRIRTEQRPYLYVESLFKEATSFSTNSEVRQASADGECWRSPFLFENETSFRLLTFLLSNMISVNMVGAKKEHAFILL